MSFSLGANAVIKVSGEKGVIIGETTLITGKVVYLLRYCNNFGVAVEQWWDEDALDHVSDSKIGMG